eukprot:scaffold1955_cov254-Pinguiococcus_pyrenoidosus.AAC.6
MTYSSTAPSSAEPVSVRCRPRPLGAFLGPAVPQHPSRRFGLLQRRRGCGRTERELGRDTTSWMRVFFVASTDFNALRKPPQSRWRMGRFLSRGSTSKNEAPPPTLLQLQAPTNFRQEALLALVSVALHGRGMDPHEAPPLLGNHGHQAGVVELAAAEPGHVSTALVVRQLHQVDEVLVLAAGDHAGLSDGDAAGLEVGGPLVHALKVDVHVVVKVRILDDHPHRRPRESRQGLQRLEGVGVRVVHRLRQQSRHEGASGSEAGRNDQGGDADLEDPDEKSSGRRDVRECFLQRVDLEAFAAVGPRDEPRDGADEEEIGLLRRQLRLVAIDPLHARGLLARQERLDRLGDLQGKEQRGAGQDVLDLEKLRGLAPVPLHQRLQLFKVLLQHTRQLLVAALALIRRKVGGGLELPKH